MFTNSGNLERQQRRAPSRRPYTGNLSLVPMTTVATSRCHAMTFGEPASFRNHFQRGSLSSRCSQQRKGIPMPNQNQNPGQQNQNPGQKPGEQQGGGQKPGQQQQDPNRQGAGQGQQGQQGQRDR